MDKVDIDTLEALIAIDEMHFKGYTNRQLSSMLGMNKSYLSAVLHKLSNEKPISPEVLPIIEINNNTKKFSDKTLFKMNRADVDLIREKVGRNKDVENIAELLNVRKGVIYRSSSFYDSPTEAHGYNTLISKEEYLNIVLNRHKLADYVQYAMC
ncbi:MAG: hypothetical protein WCS17_14100 [Prevotella sp.]